MRLSRLRLPALAALLVLSASCVDGDATGASGEGPVRPAGIALSPVFPQGVSLVQNAPISRIRVTVFLSSDNTVLHEQVVDVDPNQSAWDLEIDFQLPSSSATAVDLLLELLSVTNGVETVEWSGRQESLTVTGTGQTAVQDVPVGRGPPTNLAVTGITATPSSSEVEEGATTQLSADVQTSDPSVTPVVAWASSNTGIATVDANGLVTGILPGTVTISAAAGAFSSDVTVQVIAVPAGVRVTPAEQLIQRIPAEVEFQAEVVDARGAAIAGQGVVWSTTTQGVLEFLNGSRFRVIGEGTGRAVATAVANANLQGIGTVNVQLIDADVRVTSTIDRSSVLPGEQVTVEIVVENLGPAVARGVVTSYSLDSGLSLVTPIPSVGSLNEGAREWTIGDMAVGARETLRLVLQVDASIKNVTLGTSASAAASSASPDPDPTNNQTAQSVEVGEILPNLDVVAGASVSNATPAETETVAFTMTFTNTGSTPVNAVVANVAVDAGLTPTGQSTSQGTYDGTLGTWAIGTIPAGGTASLQIDAVVQSGQAGQELGVTAEMTSYSDAVDTNSSNDRARATVRPVGADVAIEKVVNRTSQVEGDTVVFTVTARNVGSTPVSNVQVQDALPTGMTLVRATPSSGAFTSGIWTIPSIQPGGSETLQLRVVLDRGTAGRTLTNTASLQRLLQTDTNPSNDEASASVRSTDRVADVSVEATASKSDAVPGETVEVQVRVENAGPQTAEGVEVALTLPEGLRVEDVRFVRGSWTDGTITWTVGELPAGEGATLTAFFVVPSGRDDAEQGIVATATSTGSTDPDTSNNSARAVFTPRTWDLQVRKLVSRAEPTAGDTVTFQVIVKNNSTLAATNVVVSDSLPIGLSFESARTTSGTFVNALWTLPRMEPGQVDTLTLVARTAGDRGGQTLTNRASLQRADQADRDSSNDSGTASVTPQGQSADIRVRSVASDLAPQEGSDVDITTWIVNDGPSTAKSVQVTKTIPTGLTEVMRYPPGASAAQAPAATDVGDIAPGDSISIVTTVNVGTGTATQSLVVEIRVTGQTGAVDPDQTNNLGAVTLIPVIPVTDLRITATASDLTPNEGETVDVVVWVVNDGPNTATDIEVGHSADVGLSDGTPDVPTGSYDAPSRKWSVGTLNPGDSARITLRYVPASGTSEGILTAVASIDTFASALESNPGNNAAAAGLTIEAKALDFDFETLGQTEFVVGGFEATSAFPIDPGTPGLLHTYTTAIIAAGSLGTRTLPSGAELTIDADGAFQYLPPVGLVNQVDTFVYHYEGGTSATVSMNINHAVWWLDGDFDGGPLLGAEAPADEAADVVAEPSVPNTKGTSFDPFTEAGDILTNTNSWDEIVVLASDAPYDPVTFLDHQYVFGEGYGYTSEAVGEVVPPGDYPVFTNNGSDPAIRVYSDVSLFGIEGQAGSGESTPQPALSAVEITDAYFYAVRLGGNSKQLVELAYNSGRVEFQDLVVDNAAGDFLILGGDATNIIDVSSWVQEVDGDWAIDIDDNRGPVTFSGARLNLFGYGIRIIDAEDVVSIQNEILLNSSVGVALYLEDNDAPITIDNFDATTTSEDGGIYIESNAEVVNLPSVRFDAEEYATVRVESTELDATFTRLHYSADGDGYAGDAVRFRFLDQDSDLTFEDIDIRAYGGDALRIQEGEDSEGASPEGAALVARRKVPVTIPNDNLANVRTEGGYGYAGTALYLENIEMRIDLGTLFAEEASSGITLINTTGTLTADDVHIDRTSNSGVYIAYGDPTVDLKVAEETIYNDEDYLFEITNTSGANISFEGGSITDDGGSGIYFGNNSGSLLKINSNLTLEPGLYSTGLNAFNGGTIEILGTSNVVRTVYGQAVTIDGVTIGAGGVRFATIDVTGDDGGSPATGMRLQDTGVGGQFLVAPVTGGSGAGGNFTGLTYDRGILLDNAHNVRLEFMDIEASPAVEILSGSSGIDLVELDLTESAYSGPALNVSGAVGDLLIEETYADGGDDIVRLESEGTGELDVTILNSYFGSGITGDALRVISLDQSDLNLEMTGGSLTNFSAAGLHLVAQGTSNLTAVMDGTTVSGGFEGILIEEDGAPANIYFDVRNSTFGTLTSDGIFISGGSGTIEGRIFDNDITAGGSGIFGVGNTNVSDPFSGMAKLLIQGNDIISDQDGVDISPESYDSGDTGSIYLNVLDNIVDATNGPGLKFRNLSTSSMCLNVAANDSEGGVEDPSIDFTFDAGGSVLLERIGGGSGTQTTTQIRDRLEHENPLSSNGASGSGDATGVAHGTCMGPSMPTGLQDLPPVMIPARFEYTVATGVKSGLNLFGSDLDDAALGFVQGTLTGPGTPDQSAVFNVAVSGQIVTLDFDTSKNPPGTYLLPVTVQDANGDTHTSTVTIVITGGGE